MYLVEIFDGKTGHAIDIYLSTQTEVLDFISLIGLARNDDISISIQCMKGKKTTNYMKYAKGVDKTNDETKPLR